MLYIYIFFAIKKKKYNITIRIMFYDHVYTFEHKEEFAMNKTGKRLK